ncbi:hypothetical protein KW787_00525 [Candidatus Pacearchaeota archaeon]|nr:hypothetical protein [Candidatus Pacearchaeota archaeon]
MKRKGVQGMPMEYIIGAVIAAVVIGTLAIGVVKFDLINKVQNIFPSFGENQSKVEGIQLIRYNIADEITQYYDGNDWIDFSKTPNWNVILADKHVYSAELVKDFKNYYYTWKGVSYSPAYQAIYDSRGIRSNLISNPPLEIRAFGRDPDKTMNLNRGYVYFYQTASNLYYLSLEGTLYSWNSESSRLEEVSSPIVLRQYGDSVKKWRDDVFAVPVNIRYNQIVDENGKSTDKSENGMYFCSRKIGANFILVDLSKPVSSNTVCA